MSVMDINYAMETTGKYIKVIFLYEESTQLIITKT